MSLISNLKVKFSADNKPLEKGVKKAKKTVGGFGKSLKKIAGLMAGAFAFKKIADFVSSSVKAYDIQIQAEKKLERQLISNGKTSRATLTDYKKFASELQNITTVGDETTLGLLQLAESMDSIDAKKATKGTIGLAKAFGIDLRSALKMVVLAEKGDFTMLQRYVPALRSATTAVEKAAIVQKTLADGFKLATVEAKTGLGPAKQLSNSYGDLKETIGSKFFGDSSPFIKFLSNTVKWFDGIIKSSPVDDLELTRLKVNTLTTELALSNTPLKRRKTILDELKKIAPETVKGINAEKINYKKLTTQVEAYNKVMIQKIALSNITKEDSKILNALGEKQAEIYRKRGAVIAAIGASNTKIANSEGTLQEKYKKTIDYLKKITAEEVKAGKKGEFSSASRGGVVSYKLTKAAQLLANLKWAQKDLAKEQAEYDKQQADTSPILKRNAAIKDSLDLIDTEAEAVDIDTNVINENNTAREKPLQLMTSLVIDQVSGKKPTPVIPKTLVPIEAIEGVDNLDKGITFLQEHMEELGIIAGEVFIGLGDTIADELFSASVDFKGFAEGMKDVLVNMVKRFIAAAIAALALAAAISLIPGMAGGVFGKADAGIKFGGAFMKGFKGFAGMAEGGVVPSGYPNDSYPTMLTSGETVTPPHKLANNSGSIEVHGILRGKDIYLSSEKYKSNQNRLT